MKLACHWKSILQLFLTLAMALSLTACGTISSMNNPGPYSGVRENAAAINGERGLGAAIMWPIAVIDMPFSFLFDTVLLPVTVPIAVTRTVTSD